MTRPQLNALGLVASDLDQTVAFYRALGCDLPDPPGEDGGHLVAQLGDFRLMIDTEEIIRSFDPDGVHVDLYAPLLPGEE